MSASLRNYYRILQVDPSAEPEVIEGAYRRLASKYHPDKNPSPDATRLMQDINEAYEILHDSVKRANYDAERRAHVERRRVEKTDKSNWQRTGATTPTERDRWQEEWRGTQHAEYERQQRERAEAERRRVEYEQWQREQVETKRRIEQEQQRKQQGNIANVTCPRCRQSDKVWKVSVLNSQSGKFPQPKLLRSRGREKPHPDILFPFSVASVMYVFFLFALLLNIDQSLLSALMVLIGGMSVIVYLIIRPDLVAARNREQREMRGELDLAKSRWNDLYYCQRDDGVFDPKENVLIPDGQMADYLYRSTQKLRVHPVR